MRIKPIRVRNHTISPIIISTALGHSGEDMFSIPLLNRWPPYRRLMQAVEESGVIVLTKSSTYKRLVGNFQLYRPWTWGCVRRLKYNGMLNAYGLTNDGVEVNAPKIARANKKGFRAVPNFYPQFSGGQRQAIAEILQAIENYRYFLGSFFWALEINLSCPNAEKIQENMPNALALVRAVRRAYPDLIIIGKISILHCYEFVQELVSSGVDIVHAVNTLPYDLVFPDGPQSPLAAMGGGGVSGGPAFQHAFHYNKNLRQKIPDTPLIMGCGVTEAHRAGMYYKNGADAVSLCTICRLNPGAAEEIIKDFMG